MARRDMTGEKYKNSKAKEYWLSDEGRSVIIYHRAVSGMTKQQIADDIMHIAKSTLYAWEKENSNFSDALNTDKASLSAILFHKLVKLGKGDVRKVTTTIKSKFKDGKFVASDKEERFEQIPPDGKALKYALENMDPSHFKSKIENTVTGADGGAVKVETLTDADVDARIKELESKLKGLDK